MIKIQEIPWPFFLDLSILKIESRRFLWKYLNKIGRSFLHLWDQGPSRSAVNCKNSSNLLVTENITLEANTTTWRRGKKKSKMHQEPCVRWFVLLTMYCWHFSCSAFASLDNGLRQHLFANYSVFQIPVLHSATKVQSMPYWDQFSPWFDSIWFANFIFRGIVAYQNFSWQ